MKAVVTGAAGFVGSTLSRELIAQGHDVVGVDSFTDYYDPAIKRRNLVGLESMRLVEGDLLDLDLVTLLEGADVVFHQAGQPGVRKSWGKDFEIYSRQNIDVTQKLLEAAKSSSALKRFVYASSSSVYGNSTRYPTLETDRPQPVSPYGVTKLAAEHLCSLYAENFGVPTTSLRYFTVYGPGQRPDMAFTRFVQAAVTGREIVLYGDGQQVRDFTFVSDIVAANLLAAGESGNAGAVYNVSGGSDISVLDALRIIEDVSGARLRVKHLAAVAGDVRRTGGDARNIRERLGWAPEVTIEEGLARHVAWASETYLSAAE